MTSCIFFLVLLNLRERRGNKERERERERQIEETAFYGCYNTSKGWNENYNR